MNAKFDAIVIGAGVIGSSVAYELARTGKTVCVIDKSAGAGQGSTSASSAIVRFTYSTRDAVALSWEAYHCWKDWQNHLEAPSSEGLVSLREIGYVMPQVPGISLQLYVDLFQDVGIECEILNAKQLQELIPTIDVGQYWPPKRIDDDEFWADATSSITTFYTPRGGYVSDPLQAAVNLADAAKRKGVVFKFRTRVAQIDKDNNRVCCVITDSGECIEAPIIVNVAGPWSGQVNSLAGAGGDFTITTRPMRQEVHHVSAPKELSTTPCLGDLDVGIYSRPELGDSLLIGGSEPECDPFQWVDNPDDVNMTRTQELFNAQVTRAARRFPNLQVPSSPSGVVGVYDVASDWAPIYDKSDIDGFYVAIGTSGNQFKNAPTAGQIMASIIDAVESGHDHDNSPVQFRAPHTGLVIDTSTFSRKRHINQNSTGTVLG